MELSHVVLLLAAGLLGGYIAGLAGLGGGIVFAPVLLFHFESIGVPPDAVAPLTIGTSLLCTTLASSASAHQQLVRGAVMRRVAWSVGLMSAASVLLVSLITTSEWFDARAFQKVFAVLLLAISGQLLWQAAPEATAGTDGPSLDQGPRGDERHGTLKLASLGFAAGAVSTAAGVGGGVVLVPAYHRLLSLPMQVATGTSSATIVIIGLIGAVNYALHGWQSTSVTSTSLGYVDVVRALPLAGGALLSARWGVATAHRLNPNTLRRGFAVLVIVLAVRLLTRALAG